MDRAREHLRATGGANVTALLPLTPDGQVSLHTYRDQRTDPAALATVLAHPASEVYTTFCSERATLGSGSTCGWPARCRWPGPDAGQYWEAGTIGHGPRGGELATHVAEELRIWGCDYRSAHPTIRLTQDDHRESLTGQFTIDKTFTRLAISWE